MLDLERRQQIVKYVEQHSGASVAELSRHLKVSEATVRRDLLQLSKQGLIQRARGGAVPRRLRHAQAFPEPPILQRAALQAAEKEQIGRAAAAYVEDGDAIIIAGGTTTAAMIPHLAERRDLSVITNSLRIATLLTSFPQVTVIVLGGQLRHHEFSLVGPLTDDALENIRADKLFMGSPAVHVDYGLSADDMAEVQADRRLIASAREVILLVDHTKFGRIGTVRLAPIQRVSRIVTDRAAPAHDIATLRDLGLSLDLV